MTNILIVDDDAAVREIIGDGIDAEGRSIAYAASGAEALAKIAKVRFDLVILDRTMPEMSGLQVLQSLRANPATAKLKVIVCTGSEKLAEVDEAFAAGANDYIVKPPDFEKLNAKVAHHTRPG